jgi:LysR family hydrogen peroxide-inducible transcriptional activator
MVSLRQLEYLVALDDHGHFGRAANALNVTQPTLSQQVKQLEVRLGCDLVERTSTGAIPTPVGRQVVERARHVLIGVDDIRKLAAQASGGLVGTIRFGVTPTLGPYLMPVVISRLHRAYPDVRMHVRDGIPDEQLDDLRRGHLDLMLSPLPLTGDDIEIQPLFRERLVLVAPPDDPLFDRASVTRADLAGAALLGLDKRHHHHRQVVRTAEELGAQVLGDYEGTSLDSICQMAASGLGLALLPELYLLSDASANNSVRRIEVEDWSASRSIAAVWRRGSPLETMFAEIAERIAHEARATLEGVAF